MELSTTDQLAFSTVRIECLLESGAVSIGTGFFFDIKLDDTNSLPLLFTNHHVIANSSVGKFQLTEANGDGSPVVGKYMTIEIRDFKNLWTLHPDSSVDLCAMPIAPLLRSTDKLGKHFFRCSFSEDIVATRDILSELMVLDEVIMIGYPIGIWDSRNNMPIFRKGVTATRPDLDFEGRKEFMIDTACFPGSSGSPVLLFNSGVYITRDGSTRMGGNRLKLLGIIYSAPQFTVEGKVEMLPVPVNNTPRHVSHIPVNLGLVIKAERILDFKSIFLSAYRAG